MKALICKASTVYVGGGGTIHYGRAGRNALR